MHTPTTFSKPCNKKRCLQSKGSHWQISPYKFWKAYLMIVTTTFSTKVLKNQLAKSRHLKTNLNVKTQHAKLQYPSVCRGSQIWRTSSSRNWTCMFQDNLQRYNWYHYQFDSGQVWRNWIQSVWSGWAVILRVRKQRRSFRWNHDRLITIGITIMIH